METRQLSGLSYEFAIVLWHGEDLSLYIFFIPEFWGVCYFSVLKAAAYGSIGIQLVILVLNSCGPQAEFSLMCF